MFLKIFYQLSLSAEYFSFEPEVIQHFNELEIIQKRMVQCEVNILHRKNCIEKNEDEKAAQILLKIQDDLQIVYISIKNIDKYLKETKEQNVLLKRHFTNIIHYYNHINKKIKEINSV